MGRVHRWNDPAITHLNPNVALPDREITTVRRMDSSGTT
jgi:phosphate transport system substrate-binding protein